MQFHAGRLLDHVHLRVAAGYYAAYALDPDGNNVEAVHHGAAKRSAASVVIESAGP